MRNFDFNNQNCCDVSNQDCLEEEIELQNQEKLFDRILLKIEPSQKQV